MTASPERLSFDKVPEVYDRIRPSYPDALFDDLLAYAGAPAGARLRALEIGPGTGQATASLLARGTEVTAVEIGANLVRVLRDKFRDEAALRIVNAAFEDAPVESAAYDLVVSATAFHWVDPELRWHKTRDALRPGGAVAIISTNQIASDADRGFFDRTFPIYLSYRPGEQRIELQGENVVPAEHEDLHANGLFEDIQLRRYRWDQTYTTERYADLVRSYGSSQTMEPAALESLIAGLSHVIDREYGGSITRPLVITLTLGRKPGLDAAR